MDTHHQVLGAWRFGRVGVPNQRVVIAASTVPNGSMGLITTEFIPGGTLITPAGNGEVVAGGHPAVSTRTPYRLQAGNLYFIGRGPPRLWDGMATMANSIDFTGWPHNAVFVVVQGVFYLMSVSDILPGEEVLVDSYGVEFWQQIGFPSGNPVCLRPAVAVAPVQGFVPHMRGQGDENVCFFCRTPEFAGVMLICDGCGNGFHTTCLSPPLIALPRNPARQWYCGYC
jgi:hypothetical protein